MKHKEINEFLINKYTFYKSIENNITEKEVKDYMDSIIKGLTDDDEELTKIHIEYSKLFYRGKNLSNEETIRFFELQDILG